MKKLLRTQFGMVGGMTDIQPLIDEVADVVISANVVARKLGIDLGAAIRKKFNETSDKHGFVTKL